MKKFIALSLVLLLFTACAPLESANKEAKKETLRIEVGKIAQKLQLEYDLGNIDTKPTLNVEDEFVTPTPCDEYTNIKEENALCFYTYRLIEESGETKALFTVQLLGRGEYLGLDAESFEGKEPTVGEIDHIE